MMQLAGPARASLARFPSPVERDLLGARRALFNPNADPGHCAKAARHPLPINDKHGPRLAQKNAIELTDGEWRRAPGKIGKYTDSAARTFTGSVVPTETNPAQSLAAADKLSCVALRENQANEIGIA
jgi:hypothetical protein